MSLSICPHLGTAGDWAVAYTNPTAAHRCYARTPPGEPDISYQVRFCLNGAHPNCPFYTGRVTPPPEAEPDRRRGPDLWFGWRDIASALAVLVVLLGGLLFAVEQGLVSRRGVQVAAEVPPMAATTVTLTPSATFTALLPRASQVASPRSATATPSPARVLRPRATWTPVPAASTRPSATPTVTAVPTVVPPPLVYSVRAGDSLESIAQQYERTVQALRDANGMINVTSLDVGQRLLIPQLAANATAPLPTPAVLFTASAATNVRQGPGTDYPRVGRLSPGDSYRLVARNKDALWLQLRYGAITGWVAADAVDVTGDPTVLPTAVNIAPEGALVATSTESVPTSAAAP